MEADKFPWTDFYPRSQQQASIHEVLLLQIVVVESCGGKDEPVDTLTSSLVDINVSPTSDPLRGKETPNQAIYQAYEETGTDLAQVRPSSNVCNWGVRFFVYMN